MGRPHTFRALTGTVVVTAIHAGHELRPAMARRTALDDATRLREEDPYTDRLIPDECPSVVAHRSRFEIDLNRARDSAVYRHPDDAWGLDLWREELDEGEVAESTALYDDFYRRLAADLDARAAHGPFVVLDLHSYNHRRGGPGSAAGPAVENPEINVGTGSVDDDRWRPLVTGLMADLSSSRVAGHHPDVRENVRFRGGNLSTWVNRRYGGRGCAIALEFKKVFMDEWTGRVDDAHLTDLAAAIAGTLPGLVRRLPEP